MLLTMCSVGGGSGCKCDPTGVASPTQPCNSTSGECQCRSDSDSSVCVSFEFTIVV